MRNQQNNLKYIRAKNRVEREKGFYMHLAIYIIVNIGITAFKLYGSMYSWDAFTGELIGFNVLSTWFVWGIILLFHFVVFKFGGQWEDRKIEELMRDELSKKK